MTLHDVQTKREWDEDAPFRALMGGNDQPHLPSEEQVVRANVEALLAQLYSLDEEVGLCKRDKRAHMPKGMASLDVDEFVNWGDLGVTECVKHGLIWSIVLEEAKAGECPNLCRYVQSWMQAGGWPWECTTSW